MMQLDIIVSAVRAVALQAHNPAAEHWKAVWKIPAYLKSTKDLEFEFQWRGGSKLPFFSDAPTGITICGRFRVWWSCSKIKLTLSTSEAEYITMTHEEKTVLEVKAVIDFFQLHFSGNAIMLVCTRITGEQKRCLKISRVLNAANILKCASIFCEGL